MNFTWFKIFNKAEFEALGLTSKKYTLILQGIGQKDILVTKGEGIGITYEGIFLSLKLNDQNPFPFDGYAIYEAANQDIYLGVEIEN